MLIQKSSKIGEVVADNFHAAKIFESFGLDFCCGGKRTIEEACTAKKISIEDVLKALETGNTSHEVIHYDKWNPGFLSDYIVNNHHSYVLTSMPVIEQHLGKVIFKHGEKYPFMEKIGDLFTSLKYELTAHMAKEEKMLFPYIKKMEAALESSLDMPAPPFGTVESPIKVMEAEHEQARTIMREISELTNGFTPPEDACTTHTILLKELDEFEQDLHKHVHLENNILFPKASELEAKLNKAYVLS